MPEWFSPERGYYIARHLGKKLEIVRNTDPTDKRRYVARVDDVALPRPCYSIPQAKTKAIKWAEHPPPPARVEEKPETQLDGDTHSAIIPYVESLPVIPDNPVMMEFKIVGKIPSHQFAHAIAHLKATVDMLREEGAIADCDIEPPARVKL